MAEAFSQPDMEKLTPFFSNFDRDVFVLRNLPESVKGALFSRYSRSPKGLRRLFLDEFAANADLSLRTPEKSAIDPAKANAFYERVLDGYGDDSVGELGGCHVAFENVSILATKEIEDARIGGSPLEKSTRYVYFDQKVNGEYLFHRDARIMASPLKNTYVNACNRLFDTYTELAGPLSAWMEQQFPIHDFAFMVDPVTREERLFSDIGDDAVKKRATSAYKAALRANVCDILRYLLPTATLTNVGVYGNGRFYEYLLRRLYSHPVAEMQQLAAALHRELDTEIPAFVRRAKRDAYFAYARHAFKEKIAALIPASDSTHFFGVESMFSDADAETSVLGAILFSAGNASLVACRQKALGLNAEEKKRVLDAYVGTRTSRRDKPGRALENAFFEFDVLCDYGSFRDLHRHRMMTQERQYFSPDLGFGFPGEIVHTEFEAPMVRALEKSAEDFAEIAQAFPLEAQYVLPLGYKIRFRMKMNLRQAMHFCELRSAKQGHASYRDIAQQIAKHIVKKHPLFAPCFQFVDWNTYRLGRLTAEMKQEHKRAKWAGE